MTRARQFWNHWLDFSRDVAAFQGRLWLSVVYVVVLGPIALLARISGNPLLPKFRGASFTHERKPPDATLDDARRQGA
ncbi:MAG TPA: hypothetical protein VFA60_01395 [Terriglobales bacterium]|nr:hypothetical protein [Terriglobales bacterium]